MELRVAKAWKVRPSELDNWSRRDLLAAIALLQYEGSVGPCGHPHFTTGGDGEGWWEVKDEQFCWACASLEEYKETHKETGLLPGQLLRVVDTRIKEPVKE